MNYQTFLVSIENHVAHVKFNQPGKANALNALAWTELKTIFESMNDAEEVRVIVLSGEGKHFCSGIDLSLLLEITKLEESCAGRKREQLRKQLVNLQAAVSSIELCQKPVIAAISGGCIGAGLDIACACDMRYASMDAFFTIKEIDMGIVADLGTLQRLPGLVGEGIVREMAYTGRNVGGQEAEHIKLVNQCFDDREALIKYVGETATSIAAKSPLSIRGTKHILNYSRDHSVTDSLHYMATWNAAMLLSEDLTEAFHSKIEKRDANFKN